MADSKQNPDLKAEVEAAMMEEMARLGVEFRQARIWERFKDRGAGRSTVYRWMELMLRKGAPGAAAAREIEGISGELADTEGSIRAVADALPRTVRMDQIVVPRAADGSASVLTRLNDCIVAAEQCMAKARDEEGKPKNSRLLLSAADNLRRCLETGAKLADTLRQISQVDRFHEALIEEVAKESPECAERIALRLGQTLANWG